MRAQRLCGDGCWTLAGWTSLSESTPEVKTIIWKYAMRVKSSREWKRVTMKGHAVWRDDLVPIADIRSEKLLRV